MMKALIIFFPTWPSFSISTRKSSKKSRTLRVRTDQDVDGCFWHGCPQHATWPKTRAAFWKAKITTNRARDRKVNRLLRAKDWTVFRVWEHELRRRNESKLLKRLQPLGSL